MIKQHRAGLFALYVDGARQLGLAPLLRALGIKPDYVQRWFDSFDGAIDYEITDMDVIAGDDVAFATAFNPHGRNGNERRKE